MSNELKQRELQDLLGKIQDHLDNSETLAGIRLAGIHLQADAEGDHTCCCNGITMRVPDSVSCSDMGCADGDC